MLIARVTIRDLRRLVLGRRQDARKLALLEGTPTNCKIDLR
jgi:hypothetical protein